MLFYSLRFLTASWHLQFSANVSRNFGGVIVDEVPDSMVRNAPEFSPVAQGADRRLFPLRENTTEAKANDVRQPIVIQDR